ncbi:COR domain-containing protein [Aliivibrio fischeri]|uniref:COR domain-containing protein n=1 Tax=Aliivibrio fischeri TaxID=668 RepID=UPI00354D68AD
MNGYSPYIRKLLSSCSLIDDSDFVEGSEELNYMWDSYSTDENNEVTHLSIYGMQNIDINQLMSLKSLKYLILSSCNIQQLPKDISNLKELYKLDLSNNNIQQLPEEISELEYLSELILSGNRISSIPENFGNLDELVWCYLNNNDIKKLPESFSNLQSLDILELSDNKITTLPDNFGNLRSLVELFINNNQLQSLPRSMLAMKNLDNLQLYNNKLPINIDELKGMYAFDIINIIVNVDSLNTTSLNEFKLLVVGDERVGKTSIINRILGNNFDLNSKSTQGVEISNGLVFGDFKVNLWDFAGQEITHQTHQFFLSKRSLYFLVIDAQTEDDSYSIYNWLSTIKSYGGDDSPIIVIINKIDLNEGYTFDYDLYSQQFNIKNVIYSSAKDNKFHISKGKNIVFSNLIIEQAKNIKGLDFKIPLSWMKVKKHLENKSYIEKDIIELNEFEGLCNKYKINSLSDQKTLLALFNQIGTVVAYVDDERLNIIQIINPSWLTNAVYKIIRSNKIKNDGLLDYNVIQDIFLCDDLYRERHFRWLMDLLIQFGLAFEIKSKTLLIPAKLSKTQPNFCMNDYNHGFGYRFNYNSFLKGNILSQLIVNLNKMINVDSPRYWKKGVFLKFKRSKAVVILDEIQNVIDIHISGNCPDSIELRSYIVSAIRNINDDRYDVDEMVAIKDNQKTLEYESYDYLIELIHNGYEEHIIKVRDNVTKKHIPKKININNLLYGALNYEAGFDYNKLTSNIESSLLLISESRNIVFHEKEDLINTRLRDALIGRGYFAADQSLGGESGSQKSEGERDIVIRCQGGQSKTIIEGICLSVCSKTKIDEHYTKLVNNYDTSWHKKNYLIIYSKSKKFESLCSNYQKLFSRKGRTMWNEDISIDNRNIKFLETSIDNKDVVHIFINFFPSKI